MSGHRKVAGGDTMKPKIKPKVKQGLTTGDVSRILGITQFRAIWLFERGILTEWKHPITRFRVIDLDSVMAFAKKSGIELPSKEQMEEDLKAKALKRRWAVIPVTQKEGRD